MSEPLLTSLPDDSVRGGWPDRDSSAAPPETLGGVDHAASVDPVQGMIPGRSRRRSKVERASMRILATGGIIGIATALGAVLVSNDVAGWIVGLVVGLTSVILAAVLWSSRQL